MPRNEEKGAEETGPVKPAEAVKPSAHAQEAMRAAEAAEADVIGRARPVQQPARPGGLAADDVVKLLKDQNDRLERMLSDALATNAQKDQQLERAKGELSKVMGAVEVLMKNPLIAHAVETEREAKRKLRGISTPKPDDKGCVRVKMVHGSFYANGVKGDEAKGEDKLQRVKEDKITEKDGIVSVPLSNAKHLVTKKMAVFVDPVQDEEEAA